MKRFARYGKGPWHRPLLPTQGIHTAYFYCFDNTEPDSIWAFQQYVSIEASQEFLQTASYAAYLKEVEPFLAGPPQVTPLTPMWSKVP